MCIGSIAVHSKGNSAAQISRGKYEAFGLRGEENDSETEAMK